MSLETESGGGGGGEERAKGSGEGGGGGGNQHSPFLGPMITEATLLAGLEQRNLKAKERGILVEWLGEVRLFFKYKSADTVFTAVQLLDRLLCGPLTGITIREFQCLGATCFLISSKFHEIKPPALSEMVKLGSGSFKSAQIQAMELDVLKALSWSLTPPIPTFYPAILIDQLFAFVRDKVDLTCLCYPVEELVSYSSSSTLTAYPPPPSLTESCKNTATAATKREKFLFHRRKLNDICISLLSKMIACTDFYRWDSATVYLSVVYLAWYHYFHDNRLIWEWVSSHPPVLVQCIRILKRYQDDIDYPTMTKIRDCVERILSFIHEALIVKGETCIFGTLSLNGNVLALTSSLSVDPFSNESATSSFFDYISNVQSCRLTSSLKDDIYDRIESGPFEVMLEPRFASSATGH